MHVCGAQTEFASPRLEDDVLFAEGLLELFRALESAIGRGVVDYDYFPI